MAPKTPQREEIDISEEARDLGAMNAHLETLNKEKGIQARWFRERLVVTLSATILIGTLLFSAYVVICDKDAELKKWGLQTLTALIGFAVGVLSVSKSSGD